MIFMFFFLILNEEEHHTSVTHGVHGLPCLTDAQFPSNDHVML